ncbi:MAG: hypothetical protein AAF697_03655 [Pseudomonadota bacterium]
MNEPTTSDTRSNPPANNGFDLNQPTIISLLYLGGWVTGFSGLIGIILAHVWQGENQASWAASHFTYQIRTFWVALVGIIVASVLTIVFIGVLLFPVIAIWVTIRSVLSLLKAQKQEPMPDPETLLF